MIQYVTPLEEETHRTIFELIVYKGSVTNLSKITREVKFNNHMQNTGTRTKSVNYFGS